MSYKKTIITLVLTSCIFLTGCKKASVPPTDEEILASISKPEIIDEYIYPIRPGTPEWATLSSYDQMLESISLPDSVLHSISTWGLVMTCFNYPLSGDYSAHNNQVDYMNDLSQSFNGLKELFSREDISTILLYYYRHMDFSLYPNFMDRQYIELLIGCNSYLSKLNQRQLQYLASVALEKAYYQEANFESSFPPYSYFIMANAMIHYGYKPFINYCSTNNNYTEIHFWGINAKPEQIEKYTQEFVND